MKVSRGETLGVIRKAKDLDIHVRAVEVDGVRVLELRDWIPSLEEYGRGYWVPLERSKLNALASAVLHAATEAE